MFCELLNTLVAAISYRKINIGYGFCPTFFLLCVCCQSPIPKWWFIECDLLAEKNIELKTLRNDHLKKKGKSKNMPAIPIRLETSNAQFIEMFMCETPKIVRIQMRSFVSFRSMKKREFDLKHRNNKKKILSNHCSNK